MRLRGRLSGYPSRALNAAHVPAACGLAIASRLLRLTPVKLPVLISSPPTGLLMHSLVTHLVVLGRPRKSERVSFSGRSTIPPTPRFQPWASIAGSAP